MLDVDAIRARLAALTTSKRRIRQYLRADGTPAWAVTYWYPGGQIDNLAATYGDAAFDAAAPADVAALLAEVDRLQAELERAREDSAVYRRAAGYRDAP